MNALRAFFWRLLSYLRRRRLESDLEEELRFHLEMEAEQNLRRGLDPQQARRAAALRLGGVEQVKEAYREQRGLPRLESIVQDLRFAVRSLRRSPAFTLTVLLVTTVAIGANTAIFSVVNAVLLAPLPYPDSERLAQVMRVYTSGESYPSQTGHFFTFLEQNFGAFEAIGASGQSSGYNLVRDDQAEYVRVQPVSHQYFAVLGVLPLYGRSFSREEDLEGGPQTVVLSYGLWQTRFGADPQAVGETVLLGGNSYEVIGVMPPDFRTIPSAQAWIPLRAPTNLQGRGYNYRVLGRLRAGTSLEQARQEFEAVSQSYRQSFLDPSSLLSFGLTAYQSSLSSDARPSLFLIFAAVGLLLLIGCANISSLMTARSSTRRQEIAIRTAMGGRPARIVRQLLTESLLLSLAGGALGLVAVWWSVRYLLSQTPAQLAPFQEATIDPSVLIFTSVVSVLTGILFGLMPAWQGARLDPAEVLQGTSTRSVSGDRSVRLRNLLVAAEVAVCMVLLVGSGLLVRTFSNLLQVDLGFDPRGVLTGQMSLQGSRSQDAEALSLFYKQSLERMQKLPGVEAAAVSNNLPVEWGLNLPIRMDRNGEGLRNYSVDWRYVTPDYFRVMRIPLLQGRTLTDADTRPAEHVALVNQEFARFFFEGKSALGQPIELEETLRIVGVVANVKSGGGLDTPPVPTIYVPMEQVSAHLFEVAHTYFQMNWLLRMREGAPNLDQASIREIVRSLDPAQPFAGFRSMEDVVQGAVQQQRFLMVLLTSFALMALSMALTGIYGLISYLVVQRRREIGIRMAMGAGWRAILAGVVRQGTVLAAAGAVVGLVLSLLLAGFIQQFLYEVSPHDPATLGGVALLLLAAAALASLIPGVRALRSGTIMDLLEE